MYVHLECASSLYRLSGSAIEDEGRPRLGSSERVEVRVSDNVSGMEVRPLLTSTRTSIPSGPRISSGEFRNVVTYLRQLVARER